MIKEAKLCRFQIQKGAAEGVDKEYQIIWQEGVPLRSLVGGFNQMVIPLAKYDQNSLISKWLVV